MDDTGFGAGLAAFGFWAFLATVVVAALWESVRRRDAQQRTLRQILESGQELDVATVNAITNPGGSKETIADLRVAGIIVGSLSPGLVIFGVIMGIWVEADLIPIMFAVGVLLAFIAGGLLGAAWMIERWQADADAGLHED